MQRLLIVESCPRALTEKFLKHVYQAQRSERVDLLTCYSEAPAAFDPKRGLIYSIHEPGILSRLAASRYTLLAIFCAGSPILNKWKWAIALRLRLKVLIVNENADYFYLDFANRHIAKRLLAQRLRAHSIDARAIAELLLVPFTIAFLVSYALIVHTRRLVHRFGSATGWGRQSAGKPVS